MKKIKKILIFVSIYSFFIIIGDLIYSNFTKAGKIDYNCFQYFDLNYNQKDYHYYNLKKNCVATESQRTVSPYKVFTDSNGYRYSGKKRNNLKDKVLFVGDSHTFGFGVPYQDSFPGIVETQIQQYEVYNLGVPGYGIRMYWNAVEDFFLKQKSDVTHVIVTLDMTDIADMIVVWEEIPITKYGVLKEHHIKKEIDAWDKIKDSNFKGLRLLTFSLRNFLRHIKIKFNKDYNKNEDIALKSHIANVTYTELSEHEFFDKIQFENALNDIDKYFGKIADLSKKNNAKIYLIIFPWPENLIHGQKVFNWENFSSKICKKHKCEKMISLYKDFNKIKNENIDWKQLIYIDDDIHMKKFGNSIVADKIIKNIKF